MFPRLITAMVISLALLAGCASGTVDSEPAKGSNAAPEEQLEEESEPAPEPKLGESYAFDDGVSVQVSKPSKFRPSSSSSVTNPWPHYLVFEVTVVNGTKNKIDPSVFYITAQSNDKEAEEILDSERGINGSPTTSLLPGRQSRYKVVFGVDNPDDIVLDYSLNDALHEDVTFVK